MANNPEKPTQTQSKMPTYMREHHEERLLMHLPNPIKMGKAELIRSWLSIFDGNMPHDMESEMINTFYDFRMMHLSEAFSWAHHNFAMLDLGGNMAWYACVLEIIKMMEHSSWNQKGQRLMFNRYMFKTRWYDDVQAELDRNLSQVY